ncbi:hypothetical protein VPH35_013585 [Triticum aestivum]
MVKMKFLFELLRLIYMNLVIFLYVLTSAHPVVRVIVILISSDLERGKLREKIQKFKVDKKGDFISLLLFFCNQMRQTEARCKVCCLLDVQYRFFSKKKAAGGNSFECASCKSLSY